MIYPKRAMRPFISACHIMALLFAYQECVQSICYLRQLLGVGIEWPFSFNGELVVFGPLEVGRPGEEEKDFDRF